ncbi:Bug family tripartite tricarboxylate transporter substrate binding protein [Candidimonas humi]|uniref:Bug family tripartite tricarboxylate transporter substrate binding protein n=1 Tax=Candidimonas humi TaxID=683355 RepID=A0ABV8NU56_9BURK|nr:tripartite tricarboxylate transporter substrate binding protein [Candidimonas humi]
MNSKTLTQCLRYVLASAALCMAGQACAQDWPSRPVRIIVPYAAGGTTDYAGRLIAQKLTQETGQSFFVENKAGGSGTIGTAEVARAAPDGATFLTNDTSYAMLPALYSKLPWNHDTGLVPITTLVETPVVLVVPEKSPFKTMQDLVKYAKQHPGKLNFGSGGAGSSTHLQTVVFNKDADIAATHIPYKGAGDAMRGLVSNQVDFLITATPTAVPQIQGGRARALAVTGGQRVSVLPDVPTFNEAGLPAYKVMNWFGMAAPKGTSPKIIDAMYGLIKKGLSDPAIVQTLAKQGAHAGGMAPAEFAAMIRKETKVWTEAAREAGIHPQ